MNIVKSALLGSVAGLTAIAGAHAADLPVKAKAVEYVRVCSAYGAGFYYIPGTDTCLKIDGFARFDTYLNSTGTFNPAISSGTGAGFNGPGAGSAAFPYRDDDDASYLTRVRAVMGMDARTQTDYGTLRSYIRFGMNWESQTGAGSGSGIGMYFERAFIQFAGFTFGYSQSFFDTGISYAYTTLYAGSNQLTSALAYTAQFGNGFSATIALEDAANRITGVQATSAGVFSTTGGLGYSNYQSGQEIPDIVGNIRIDQAWGSAQFSAAAHQVGALTPIGTATGTSFLGQNSDDTWGWALGGAVEIKLPMIAKGDSLYIQANYADGALSYVGLSGTNQGRATGLGRVDLGSSLLTSGGAYYPLSDATWNANTLSYSTTTAWAIQAQYRHFWTPGVRSSVFGGYVDVSVSDNTVGAEDVSLWQVGANTIWSPVKNLDLGLEVLYSKVDGDVPLNNYATNGTGSATALVGGSTDVWSGGFRAQRSF
ncbi:porin [Azorhizobium oxalatiphilum]|uniref:porin n=1 Tax=Azorhizobium oxalatiphilum TaxID=980631 RepID=UPI0016697C19|nr:porin [Azorhizobium oxalatiphilum]